MFKKHHWQLHEQIFFLEHCYELLSQGFSLMDSLAFLKYIMPKRQDALSYMHVLLQQGKRFDELLAQVGFSELIISQLFLAQANGQFHQSLQQCSRLLKTRVQQKQQLQKMCVYPIILFSFICLLLLGLRAFFLPQLQHVLHDEQQDNLIKLFVLFIDQFPFVFVTVIMSSVLLWFAIQMYFKNKSALNKIKLYMYIPFIKRFVSFYYTAYFAQELAHFYLNGYQLQTMIRLFQSDNSAAILKEFATILATHAKNGRHLADAVAQLTFLQKEFVFIIQHGEKTSQLGEKLRYYANECYTQFEQLVKRKIALIQPVLFLFIGMLIVLIYATLLLPMFSLMDQLF